MNILIKIKRILVHISMSFLLYPVKGISHLRSFDSDTVNQFSIVSFLYSSSLELIDTRIIASLILFTMSILVFLAEVIVLLFIDTYSQCGHAHSRISALLCTTHLLRQAIPRRCYCTASTDLHDHASRYLATVALGERSRTGEG